MTPGNARMVRAISDITGMPMAANLNAPVDPDAEREALVELLGEEGADELLSSLVGALGFPQEDE